MESFFSRYKNALVLIVVLVAQLLALAVQVKRPAPGSPDQEGVTLIRYVVVSVVTPPERWIHNVGRGIRGLWYGYMDLVHVRQQDAVLKTEIERLRLEQASLAEDAKQGQRLEQLLDFKEHYVYKTVPAQVIGASGTDQSRTLYIDKGAKDGLAPDMPVVTADGIVGKLKDVFDHKSLVLLVSDPTSGVGVILETTRTRGILKGVPFGQLQVINVSPDGRIKAGERIVTSGGDQIFPRGMPVGTVEGVEPDPDRRSAGHYQSRGRPLEAGAEGSRSQRGGGRGRKEARFRRAFGAASGTPGCQGAGGYESRSKGG
jgi:rod shape-determining protein MreC